MVTVLSMVTTVGSVPGEVTGRPHVETAVPITGTAGCGCSRLHRVDRGKHVLGPRLSDGTTHDDAAVVEHEDCGGTPDVQSPHQIEVALGIDLDVGDPLTSAHDVGQDAARRPAGLAKGGGELHQRRVFAQRRPDLRGRQAFDRVAIDVSSSGPRGTTVAIDPADATVLSPSPQPEDRRRDQDRDEHHHLGVHVPFKASPAPIIPVCG